MLALNNEALLLGISELNQHIAQLLLHLEFLQISTDLHAALALALILKI